MKNLSKTIVLSLFAIIFVGCVGQAQKVKGNGNMIEKTRNVGNFDGIGVAGSFDVYLVAGDEGKVEIKTESNLEPYLVTEVQGDKLKIRWKKGTNVRTTKKTTVTVYVEEIDELALAGSGDIVGKSVLKSDDLDVAIAGSGDITIEVETSRLSAAVSGSGDIQLKGKTGEFDAAVAGSGDIEAYDLICEEADLKISGSGSIKSNVSHDLNARISGSGNIKYKGSPKLEDIKVSGSGNVSTY